MEFMENPFPFSRAFGSARTRKECIKSSTRVYKRLLRFTPGESVLDFDVIAALAYDDDGELNEERAQLFLKVFMPDKDDNITQLAFVQNVDTVYKNLKFLRASIMNSSKIDSVLEDVFDVAFYAILTIIIMTLLGLNPWPLLVSFSTVLVSFAFAFGPSAAKWIEGTLMIAVRRPYGELLKVRIDIIEFHHILSLHLADIGDRITLISGDSITIPTSSDAWLVVSTAQLPTSCWLANSRHHYSH
jgi:small-conductance mechanosensitive channel